MMTNLFSIFDPSLSLFSFSWLIIFLGIFLLPGFYWVGGSFMVTSCFYFVKKEVDYLLKFSPKGMYKFVSAIFFVVAFYNFLALFPHLFSVTSHLLVTFPFAYCFWLSIIIFSVVNSLGYFLSHLIPVGTPIFLVSFMVIVEVLSNLIRPLALTFRLTANMMAGHLLMSLIGGFLISLSFVPFMLGSIFQLSLVFMELGVSLIQAYVFTSLLLLYISESKY